MMYLTLEHQGRELLHGIALMLKCLDLPSTTTSERRRWSRGIRQSRAELEALYAAGLSRDMRPKSRSALAPR